jgi:acetolactate synthase I/II/III large subunit
MLQSTAFCTMGCALPLAMGHKLAKPAVPVIAFMGDAGLEMVAGELATLRDWGLPVVVVVLVDQALALIDLKQRSSNRPQVGVTFGATDFPAVARAFGGNGIWVESVAELETAFAEASSEVTRFTLIAARIDSRAYEGKL